MPWFLLALIGPFLYALTNYIDKVLLQKYFKEGGVGTILIFSGLLSLITLPILYAIDPSVFDVPLMYVFPLAGTGVLYVYMLYFYLKSLEQEEVSVSIIFYQLVPVFAAILGYFILGEILTTRQLIAMAVIILGTSIVSFEIDTENKFKLRFRTVFYMIAASLCWALAAVVFKAVALQENVVRSLFWEFLIQVLVGAGLYLFIKRYRNHFKTAFKLNSGKILSLNILNECIYIGGNVVMAFAYLLAPVSLVLLANSYQALFALGIGAFLTLFFPALAAERLHISHVWQKAAAIAVTAVGTYILFM